MRQVAQDVATKGVKKVSLFCSASMDAASFAIGTAARPVQTREGAPEKDRGRKEGNFCARCAMAMTAPMRLQMNEEAELIVESGAEMAKVKIDYDVKRGAQTIDTFHHERKH